MSRIFIAIFAVLLFVGGVLAVTLNSKSKERPILPVLSNKPEKYVEIKGKKIYVEVVDSQEEKTKGLSGRKSLPENAGMLFVFAQKTYPSFWMKDMNIALDMIWIGDGKVVDIDENVPFPPPEISDRNLTLYSPVTAADHVLEVNAGYVSKNEIKVGDEVKYAI